MSAAQSGACVIESSYFTLAGESGVSIKEGLLFQTGERCELGKGIISKYMVIQRWFKTDAQSTFDYGYSKLISFWWLICQICLEAEKPLASVLKSNCDHGWALRDHLIILAPIVHYVILCVYYNLWILYDVSWFETTLCSHVWWLEITTKRALLACLRYSRTDPSHSELLI